MGFLLLNSKVCCWTANVSIFQQKKIIKSEKMYSIRKLCFSSEKTTVYQKRLQYIRKVFCSSEKITVVRKDWCSSEKIAVYQKRLLFIRKDYSKSEKITVNQESLLFNSNRFWTQFSAVEQQILFLNSTANFAVQQQTLLLNSKWYLCCSTAKFAVQQQWIVSKS